MKKRAKILLIVIIIVAVLMALLYLASVLMEINMTGNSISSLFKKESVDKQFLDTLITGLVNSVNEQEKYLEFIEESEYDSMELIIDKNVYYLEYNHESEEVVETGEKECDFAMKISARKFNKALEKYQQGDVEGAAMKVVGEIPRRVKFNLFEQCLNTPWCKSGDF